VGQQFVGLLAVCKPQFAYDRGCNIVHQNIRINIILGLKDVILRKIIH
jgi:hypothetical protein